MKMKRFFVALFAIFAMSSVLSLSSCKKDDPVVDAIVDHIVNYSLACGNYDCTMEVYVTDDVMNLDKDDLITTEKMKATIKEGTDLETLIFDDDIEFLDFTNASNGFVFNLKTINTDGMTITPVKGAELNGVKYHGIFTDEDRTFVMYYQMPLEECFDEETSDEIIESLVEAYVTAGLLGADEVIESLDQLCELLDDAKVVVKVTGKQTSL